MAEWSKAVVLKTIDSKGSGGSNPSLSANYTLSNGYFKGKYQNSHQLDTTCFGGSRLINGSTDETYRLLNWLLLAFFAAPAYLATWITAGRNTQIGSGLIAEIQMNDLFTLKLDFDDFAPDIKWGS